MTPAPRNPLTWVEIDTRALRHNLTLLRQAASQGGRHPVLCVMVKGNAYGHDLRLAAQAFIQAGVDWLGVADLGEAEALRGAGVTVPLYAVCHLPPEQMPDAVACDLRLTVFDGEVVEAAGRAAAAAGRADRPLPLHIKLETGTNRQGLRLPEARALARQIQATVGVRLEGVSTHFADIEDTTDHRFAREQLARFRAGVEVLQADQDAIDPRRPRLMAHASNTAAVLLWPEVCDHMVRFGIGAYGLWPSKETFLSAQHLGRAPIGLQPALCWKTRVAQVKQVPAGDYVGYGRTFRAGRDMRLAVLPVGYYDGYDRGLSSRGQVLIGGRRAQVTGRVAMNMVTVDVTDLPEVRRGDEVVLLGPQAAAGDTASDAITADEMAAWLGTIHYEVVTRIHERIERRPV